MSLLLWEEEKMAGWVGGWEGGLWLSHLFPGVVHVLNERTAHIPSNHEGHGGFLDGVLDYHPFLLFLLLLLLLLFFFCKETAA